jgi:pimeloyl-ACP methyl ester carboxylesterase
MNRFRLPLLLLLAVTCVALLLWRGAPDRGTPYVRQVMGQGPTVVLVHGLGSRIGHWLPVARLLARDHRVVMVSLPGHDGAAMPESLTLERAAEALHLALEGETGPLTLVGHSVGGLVVAQEALDHPERVRAIVLVETALAPQVTGAERDTLLAALRTDYDGVLRRAYMAFGRDSAQGRMLYEEVAALPPATVTPWIQMAMSLMVTERMSHLRPPLLAVLSDRSWEPGSAGPTPRRRWATPACRASSRCASRGPGTSSCSTSPSAWRRSSRASPPTPTPSPSPRAEPRAQRSGGVESGSMPMPRMRSMVAAWLSHCIVASRPR